MHKSEIITQIKENKYVVVIRGNTKKEGVDASIACIEGGIKAVEVAYSNHYAGDIIRYLEHKYTNDPSVLIGAGTVLDGITAQDAIINGAHFVVSPSYNEETAKVCNRYGVAYIPGCMTIREVVEAMEGGSEFVKLFPGSVLGPKFIKALKGPLPYASVMVTGGVSIDNAKVWFDAGADAIGIGGSFNKLAAEGKFEDITQMAKAYTEL